MDLQVYAVPDTTFQYNNFPTITYSAKRGHHLKEGSSYIKGCRATQFQTHFRIYCVLRVYFNEKVWQSSLAEESTAK